MEMMRAIKRDKTKRPTVLCDWMMNEVETIENGTWNHSINSIMFSASYVCAFAHVSESSAL